MVAITSLIGMLLIALGVGTYFGADTGRSPTAFIPSALGVLMIVCVAFATRSANARKHAMHAAVMLSLLGIIAVLGRAVPTLMKGELPATMAGIGLGGMFVLCAVHMVFSIRSFKAARRVRKLAEAKAGI